MTRVQILYEDVVIVHVINILILVSSIFLVTGS